MFVSKSIRLATYAAPFYCNDSSDEVALARGVRTRVRKR
jgi:hypothetical protein